MSRVDLKILDQLLIHHPDLEALRQTQAGQAVVGAAPFLARRLIGATEEAGHPLVEALERFAPQEVVILVGLCRGNALRTMTTTVSIMKYLARGIERREEEEEDGEETSGEDGEQMPAMAPLPGEEKKEEDSEDEEEASPLDGLDPEGMAEDAFAQVNAQSELLDQLNQLLPDMGWGFGKGHLETALLQDMSRFAALLQRSEELRKIADELGRLERTQRKNAPPARSGREAVVGVRMGGELTDVLPGELALLGSRSTEDLFYQRYTDRRLLSLELEGTMADPERSGARGPVIACVDTSGSMAGPREAVAKALILAVMRRVLPKGRRVRLMLFGGPGDFRDMDIGRGPSAMRHFLDFLGMSFNAGTDFDSPLERALELLAEARYEQADIMLVTDGYGQASVALQERLEKLKRVLGFEVISVIIDGSPRGVADFSDRVWLVPTSRGGLEQIKIEEWNQKF